MTDVVTKSCEKPDCKRLPCYGLPGNSPTLCNVVSVRATTISRPARHTLSRSCACSLSPLGTGWRDARGAHTLSVFRQEATLLFF
jgi:hypothetical protein